MKVIVFENNQNISQIPRGLGKLFPNLEALSLSYNGLRILSSNDLKQFPKLRFLNVAHNNLSELNENLFDFVPKLEVIEMENNRIESVKKNVVNSLKKLRILNLSRNQCIDKNFISNQSLMYELKSELEKCSFQLSKEMNQQRRTLSHLLDLFGGSSSSSSSAEKNWQPAKIIINSQPANTPAVQPPENPPPVVQPPAVQPPEVVPKPKPQVVQPKVEATTLNSPFIPMTKAEQITKKPYFPPNETAAVGSSTDSVSDSVENPKSTKKIKNLKRCKAHYGKRKNNERKNGRRKSNKKGHRRGRKFISEETGQ